MRLPKWLVWALVGMCLIAVVVPSTWLWLAWPEQTLREFVRLISEGQLQDANSLLTNAKCVDPVLPRTRGSYTQLAFGPKLTDPILIEHNGGAYIGSCRELIPNLAEATALDRLLARRRFYLNNFPRLEFLIDKGRIKVVELQQARR